MALSSSNSAGARTPLRAQNAEVYYSDAAIVTADDGVKDLLAMTPRVHAAGASVEMHTAVATTLARDAQ